jgi:hypothetical protein
MVIFQSAQPDLFNFIKKAIDAGEYHETDNPNGGYVQNGEVQMTDNKDKDRKTFKRPQIKLRRKMFGRIIALNVPLYEPHTPDATGKMIPLSPLTLNPATGKYINKPVQKGSIRFFADDDDLDLLLDAAAKHVDKQVRPFVVKKKANTESDDWGDIIIKTDEGSLQDENPVTNEEPPTDDDEEKN